MRRFFSAIGSLATRVESWWTLLLMVAGTGFFTWLGRGWEAVASQGLGAVIVVAVITTSLLLIALCLIYMVVQRIRDSGGVGGDTIEVPSPASSLPEVEDKEHDGIYEGAHYDLMLFVVDHLLPTSASQFMLQTHLLKRMTDQELLVHFASEGLYSNEQIKPFADALDGLTGMANSPAEFIPLDAMMRCVLEAEKHYHRLFVQGENLWESVPEADRSFEVNRLHDNWAKQHNEMIDAFERIKKNPRLPLLFRPARPSRWGGKVDKLKFEN